MRYLKMFESEGYSITDYHITDLLKDGIRLTEYEIKKLIFLSKSHNFILGNINSHNIITFYENIGKPINAYTDNNIRIKKLDDDFFIVRLAILSKKKLCYYKCDQLSGIKKCLKNEIPKII